MEIEYWDIVVSGGGLLVMALLAIWIYKRTSKVLKRVGEDVLIVGEDVLKRLAQFKPELDTISLVARPIAVRTGVVTATISHLPISKAAAQKRLDEDTKKVGWVRGEIYQTEEGSWGIHWKMEGIALLGLKTQGSNKIQKQ